MERKLWVWEYPTQDWENTIPLSYMLRIVSLSFSLSLTPKYQNDIALPFFWGLKRNWGIITDIFIGSSYQPLSIQKRLGGVNLFHPPLIEFQYNVLLCVVGALILVSHPGAIVTRESSSSLFFESSDKVGLYISVELYLLQSSSVVS